MISHEFVIYPPRNFGEDTTLAQAFSRAINEIIPNLMKRYSIEDLEESVVPIVEQEFQAFFEKGSCRLKNELTVCINPTFLNPETEKWQVFYSSCPFRGYLPLSQEELITSAEGKILLPSCQKILKNLVASYRSRITTVQVFFHLEDALEFCYSETTAKFDVIDCSNLADHVGLANLITAANGRLSNYPDAVLSTESMDWAEFAPSSEMYVEHVLNCPLSMIPTIYALKLNNHVELGSRRPPNWYIVSPVHLSWQKAIHFQNIVMSPSSSLTQFLNKLAQKCFVSERLQEGDKNSIHRMVALAKHFSPLTFQYIVNTMTQRLGDHWFEDAHQIDIPAVFNLTRRSLKAWEHGQEVTKITAEIPINSINEDAYKLLIKEMGARMLRLVLTPCIETFSNHFMDGIIRSFSTVTFSSSKEVHFIDNFSLQMNESGNKIVVSFLLTSDHNLPEEYSVYMIENQHYYLLLNFGSLKSMHSEDFHLPFPFSRQTPSALTPRPEESLMKVTSCIESESEYKLNIIIDCNKTVSGKSFVRLSLR